MAWNSHWILGKGLSDLKTWMDYFVYASKMLKTSMSWKFVWMYLKSQNKFWNLKFWFKSEKKNFSSENLLKRGPGRVVQCECIQPYHLINLNTRTWQHSIGFMLEIKFSDRIKLFQIEIEFSNFKTRFEISNKFKWIFKR